MWHEVYERSKKAKKEGAEAEHFMNTQKIGGDKKRK
jgi:hypothetical protein